MTADRTALGAEAPAPDDDRPARSPRGDLVPARLRRRLPWLAALTGVWVAGWAVPVWHRSSVPGPFARLDGELLRWHGPVQQTAAFFADLDQPWRLAVILGAATATCILGRSRRAVLALAASLAVVVLAVEAILKPLVGARPHPGASVAFPSGHTATACCLATVAVLLIGRRRGPLRFSPPRPVRLAVMTAAVAIGPVVGTSMVVLGAHTSIDVIAALPLGVTLTLLTCASVDLLAQRRRGRRATGLRGAATAARSG
jgi:membrane-associated phospholipid phosphatase